MNSTVIRCDKLTKYYGKSRGIEDLTFEVRPGQVYGFLGPNGAGKTTTIRCLLSMLRPTSGRAFLFDAEVGVDGRELRRRIGYVPGDVKLFEKQTGRWTLDYIAGLRGGPGPAEAEICERLEFDPTRRVKELSKGNKQKLALVIALMHEPELLMLDEPTSGLDPLNQQVVFDILEERVAKGATVFLSSHILPEVERVCDRVAVIRDGRVVAEESVDELLSKAIRTVHVTYAEPVPDAFVDGLRGVTSLERLGDTGLRATVTEDIGNTLLGILARPVADITVEHASLEEVFLQYYGHGEREGGAS
ncbi:MAG: ABC transporter ATP-binding protein [Anaerosomatales bacterium]